MADLSNVPSRAWNITAVTLCAVLIALCGAFLFQLRAAVTENCTQRFLGMQLGPERECAPKGQLLLADNLAPLVSFLERRWCDAMPTRRENEVYTNDAPYPIAVAVATKSMSAEHPFCRLAVTIDDKRIVEQVNYNPDWRKRCSVTVTVSPGSTYRVTADSDVPEQVGIGGDGLVVSWHELVGRDLAPRGCFETD